MFGRVIAFELLMVRGPRSNINFEVSTISFHIQGTPRLSLKDTPVQIAKSDNSHGRSKSFRSSTTFQLRSPANSSSRQFPLGLCRCPLPRSLPYSPPERFKSLRPRRIPSGWSPQQCFRWRQNLAPATRAHIGRPSVEGQPSSVRDMPSATNSELSNVALAKQ